MLLHGACILVWFCRFIVVCCLSCIFVLLCARFILVLWSGGHNCGWCGECILVW